MQKRKIICILIFIGIIIALAINIKNVNLHTNATQAKLASNTLKQSNREEQGLIIVADRLLPNAKDKNSIATNRSYLQNLINEASKAGGGIVHIPTGTYYFASAGRNGRDTEDYVIKCQNNVTIEGEGIETILKPYGQVTSKKRWRNRHVLF